MADDNTQLRCLIKEIPLEVLFRITYWLKTPELGNMRLTCRGFEKLLYNTFAQEFFSQKQFMITEFSLQALVDISKSRLSCHLRRLYFGLESFRDPYQYTEVRGANFYYDDDMFWSSGAHLEMLTEAFRNLENLEDVVIRNFNSKSRSRDFPKVEWRSYGFNTALSEGAHFVNEYTDQSRATNRRLGGRTFSLIFGALGRANARPKGIEFMFRAENYLSDYSFALPPRLQPSLLPVLHNLERLHLSLLTSDYAERNSHWRLLRKFLTETPMLKDLRINTQMYGSYGTVNLLIALAAPILSKFTTASQDESESKIQLPHLQKLSLGFIEVETPILLAILETFAPSLRSFELWRVTLVPNESPACNGVKNDNPSWKAFCKDVQQIPNLDLQHIMMGNLHETSRSPTGNGSSTSGINFGDKKLIESYTGPDWKHFMDTIYIKNWKSYADNTSNYQESHIGDNSDEEFLSEDDDDEDPDDYGVLDSDGVLDGHTHLDDNSDSGGDVYMVTF